MDQVMGTLFLFLTHTDSIYKQVVIWIKADKIEELLNIMRGKNKFSYIFLGVCFIVNLIKVNIYVIGTVICHFIFLAK